MNRLFYPAIFHMAEDEGFWVSFPDFPECLTQGDNMEQAYEMAVDALGLCLSERVDHGLEIPDATSHDKINIKEGMLLVIIEFDMAEYRRKHRSKAVKKTLSIPEWLNEEAVKAGINFSQVLQEALILKLNAK